MIFWKQKYIGKLCRWHSRGLFGMITSCWRRTRNGYWTLCCNKCSTVWCAAMGALQERYASLHQLFYTAPLPAHQIIRRYRIKLIGYFREEVGDFLMWRINDTKDGWWKKFTFLSDVIYRWPGEIRQNRRYRHWLHSESGLDLEMTRSWKLLSIFFWRLKKNTEAHIYLRVVLH